MPSNNEPSKALLHIVQTELSKARIQHFLDCLANTDSVVVEHKQASLIQALERRSQQTAYVLREDGFSDGSALQPLKYAEFVELLARYEQSRTW